MSNLRNSQHDQHRQIPMKNLEVKHFSLFAFRWLYIKTCFFDTGAGRTGGDADCRVHARDDGSCNREKAVCWLCNLHIRFLNSTLRARREKVVGARLYDPQAESWGRRRRAGRIFSIYRSRGHATHIAPHDAIGNANAQCDEHYRAGRCLRAQACLEPAE